MSRRRSQGRKKAISEHQFKKRLLFLSIAIPFVLVVGIMVWQHRAGVSFLLRQWFDREEVVNQNWSRFDIRNVELMQRHADKVFGIDVSHYQGEIDWDQVWTINDQVPVDFVFIRASMGEGGKDGRFEENWAQVKSRNKIRGAYHYFRPDEDPVKQATNFIQRVQLSAGDLPPVLDIEELPRHRSLDRLRSGLKQWLDQVEEHYGVKPVLYSGDHYFNDFLKNEFSNYPLWIANYNFWIEKPKKNWDFWQFSEQGTVGGITGPVDLNLYSGTIIELEKLCLPFK